MAEDQQSLIAHCPIPTCGGDLGDYSYVGMVPIPHVEPNGNLVIRPMPVILSPMKCPHCHNWLISVRESPKVIKPNLIVPVR